MTSKRIKYEGDEIEHEDLTASECLKQWVTYSNKYNCKTSVIVEVGQTMMYIAFSKNQVKELLTKCSPTKFKNCETSTRYRLTIMGGYGATRLSIMGISFQDFEKTKENNWGAIE